MAGLMRTSGWPATWDRASPSTSLQRKPGSRWASNGTIRRQNVSWRRWTPMNQAACLILLSEARLLRLSAAAATCPLSMPWAFFW